MRNATKTLAIFFAGTVVLAIATSLSWSGSSSAAFQEDLLSVDTSAVETIQIERSSGSPIRLQRSDQGWNVAPSDTSVAYAASTGSVNELFGTLPALQVQTVVTRQSNRHPRYGVDSTGTAVTLFDADNETLGHLIVGRTRMQRSQPSAQTQRPMQQMGRGQASPITYVRHPDRPDVYSVEQSLGTIVDRTVEDWRDKTIWAVDRTKIQRVDLTFPGDSSFTMQRTAPDDTASAVGPATWVSASDTLSSTEVTSMLRLLSSPTADGFAEDASPETFGDTPYTVRLHLRDGSHRTLQLRPSPSDETYLASAETFSYVARLDKRTWDRSVLRGRSALLEREE